MSKTRHRGLRREPEGGWPLDQLFVGVGTVRTIRELFRQEQEPFTSPARAWDLALWSGVTTQGTVYCLERLHRLGLARIASPGGPDRAASFRIDRSHPMYLPLARLFQAERVATRRVSASSNS